MQRILQPGEIEALDAIDFPRIRLPKPAELFTERAARLRQLAADNPIGEYLLFVAELADGQAVAAVTTPVAPLVDADVERALEHGMPPLPATETPDPAWREVLRGLLDRLVARPDPLPDALAETVKRLRGLDDAALDALADEIFGDEPGPEATAAQPIVVAALQVVWTLRAAVLDTKRMPVPDVPTVCPVCGTPPVAGVLRLGGPATHRYLHCGLCATEWHMVRVKCSHCESTGGVRFLGVEDGGKTVLAETCDACHSYRKQVDQNADPLAEPLADDLASLRLDLLMAETEYERASMNPMLALAPGDPPDHDTAG